MAGEGAAVFVVLLFGVGGPLVLYWLVRAEHADGAMDRSAAERAARRDVNDDRERR
jgi:hypothetical protein